MFIRFKTKHAHNFDIDIVSVGNLSVGGSGKTPLVTALAAHYDSTCILLRGYGRESKGLHVVSDSKEILVDVTVSGDEAMTYAQKLPNTIVIVSEDRKAGIIKAKEIGAKIIFLDKAYSKHDIKKLDFIIAVEYTNNSCIPTGPYIERVWSSEEAV